MAEVVPVDGRAARAHRTRAAVVDALLALIEEGDLRPTAPRIAERAGVSLRSVFQHFDDMEALMGVVADRSLERLRGVGREVVTGNRCQRIDGWVAQRARLYEEITPVRRASALQEPFSPLLKGLRDKGLARARRDLLLAFAPELDGVPEPERDEVVAAIEGATLWDVWEHLRTRGGLDVDAASAIFRRSLTALLPPS